MCQWFTGLDSDKHVDNEHQHIENPTQRQRAQCSTSSTAEAQGTLWRDRAGTGGTRRHARRALRARDQKRRAREGGAAQGPRRTTRELMTTQPQPRVDFCALKQRASQGECTCRLAEYAVALGCTVLSYLEYCQSCRMSPSVIIVDSCLELNL